MRAVAIINSRARGVARKRAALERALPGHVHFTESLDHARAIVRAEIKRGVDLVVLGGGDGTFVMTLALIAEACRGEARPEPAIGMLKLGSGNALATALGATRDPVDDLAWFARGAARWHTRPMLDVLGMRAPFVGVGLDAQVLEDHARVNRAVDKLPGHALIGGRARYVMSVALRSIPRFATAARPRVRVINLGAPATAIHGADPKQSHEIATGSTIWEGDCTLVAAGTIPYFGFGLKMFAFAEIRDDRFHLRCGDPRIGEVLRNVPKAFAGTYFSDRVHDFLCEKIAIEALVSDEEQGIPLEVGGELIERNTRFEIGLGAPVTLASLR